MHTEVVFGKGYLHLQVELDHEIGKGLRSIRASPIFYTHKLSSTPILQVALALAATSLW